ncbi:hypothetical protein T4D_2992 [Trichinella pseudospiralis]|uniref:Uncharacterized protein n=1 Tax=Trichinella pseudospiralis TaxID=6337 RepID=A0A0V1F7Y0_TRIPS|nr:hypothetical protein T4D_8945 [Trichinella pseudospiralis]KRY81863.1 hypothetical protein T4D_2992 [Trichinella pseudospiralis]
MIPTPKPTWSIKNLFFALENENYLPKINLYKKYKLDIRMNDDVNFRYGVLLKIAICCIAFDHVKHFEIKDLYQCV